MIMILESATNSDFFSLDSVFKHILNFWFLLAVLSPF